MWFLCSRMQRISLRSSRDAETLGHGDAGLPAVLHRGRPRGKARCGKSSGAALSSDAPPRLTAWRSEAPVIKLNLPRATSQSPAVKSLGKTLLLIWFVDLWRQPERYIDRGSVLWLVWGRNLRHVHRFASSPGCLVRRRETVATRCIVPARSPIRPHLLQVRWRKGRWVQAARAAFRSSVIVALRRLNLPVLSCPFLIFSARVLALQNVIRMSQV